MIQVLFRFRVGFSWV